MSMTMKTNPHTKWVSRTEMNRLMAIPEAREIIEEKFAELRLYFKDKLREQEYEQDQEPGGWWEGGEDGEGGGAAFASNIIRLPLSDGAGAADGPGGNAKTKPPAGYESSECENMENLIQIVDSSRYRGEPEAEQVKIFMDYFKNHRTLRKAVLDEFFLRILPYSNIALENGALGDG